MVLLSQLPQWFCQLVVIAFGYLSISAAHGQIFVSNLNEGTISEFGFDGSTLNASLISGLFAPEGMAVSGSNLFVANFNRAQQGVGEYTTSGVTVNSSLINVVFASRLALSGSNLFVGTGLREIGEYTTSGATINASLISDPSLGSLSGLVVSGSNLFALSNGKVIEYTTSGTLVNASLISGLNTSSTMAISGSNLFITDPINGTIAEYTTLGTLVNASLISGLSNPVALTVSGSNIFVVNRGTSTIGEYAISGATINASLVSGLTADPVDIAVVPTPEPSTIALMVLGLSLLVFERCRRYRILS